MENRANLSFVRRHQVLAFVAVTFAISWAIWSVMVLNSISVATSTGRILNIVATAGPSIAALVVAAMLGRGELRRLLGGFSISRASIRWVIVALLLPLAMIAAAIAVSVAAMGGSAPVLTIAVVAVLAREFVRILFVGGPLPEEIGWRGFALPRLQARRTAFDASVVLGLIWGVWHIPVYFVPGTGQFERISGGTSLAFAIGAFVVWTIGLSILFAWLFNVTRGSLIVAVLFHASINLAASVPAAVGSTGAASFLYAGITWIVAVAVASRYGRTTLAPPSGSAVIVGSGA